MATILVVDDDSDLCQAMRSALEGFYDHAVVVANDAEGALRAQKKHPADVVVADIFMPGLDGLELIQKLWRDDQGLSIIAMSGMTGRRNSEGPSAYQMIAARALGVTETLPKPFDFPTLAAAIDRALLKGASNRRHASSPSPA
jgi:DNA-binding NtrC family response regulator